MNTRATTHDSGSAGAGRVPPDLPGAGLSRADIDRMVDRAASTLTNLEQHPDWLIASACDTILTHSPDHAIRDRAQRLLQIIAPDGVRP